VIRKAMIGKAKSGRVTSGKATSGRATSGRATSGKATSGKHTTAYYQSLLADPAHYRQQVADIADDVDGRLAQYKEAIIPFRAAAPWQQVCVVDSHRGQPDGVAKSGAQFCETLRWRALNSINRLRMLRSAPAAPITDAAFDSMWPTRVVNVGDYVVSVDYLGAINAEELTALARMSTSKYTDTCGGTDVTTQRGAVQVMMARRLERLQQTKQHARKSFRHIKIYDCAGLKSNELSRLHKAIKEGLSVLTYYPESLRAVVVSHPPWGIHTAWKMVIKPLLEASTARKFTILSKEESESAKSITKALLPLANSPLEQKTDVLKISPEMLRCPGQ
jgi:hypothetical protein